MKMDPKFLSLFLISIPFICSSGQVTVTPTPLNTPVTVPAPGTNTSPTGGTPTAVTPPPSGTTNAPAAGNNKWCVAKAGVAQTKIQAALDYACGKADCSAIQQGGACYNPNTLQNHASYAFNSYFQRNPAQTSCDFGGAASITTANPSTGSCVFPTSTSTSLSSSSPPTTPSGGAVTPPSVNSGTGNSPAVMNGSGSGNPVGMGGVFPTGVGEGGTANNNTDVSASSGGHRRSSVAACIIIATAVAAAGSFRILG